MTVQEKSRCLFECLSELGSHFRGIDFSRVDWNKEEPYKAYLRLVFNDVETYLSVKGVSMDNLLENLVIETDKLLSRFELADNKPTNRMTSIC